MSEDRKIMVEWLKKEVNGENLHGELCETSCGLRHVFDLSNGKRLFVDPICFLGKTDREKRIILEEIMKAESFDSLKNEREFESHYREYERRKKEDVELVGER